MCARNQLQAIVVAHFNLPQISQMNADKKLSENLPAADVLCVIRGKRLL